MKFLLCYATQSSYATVCHLSVRPSGYTAPQQLFGDLQMNDLR